MRGSNVVQDYFRENRSAKKIAFFSSEHRRPSGAVFFS